MLCEAEDLDTGAMWECPLLIQLNRVPQQSRRQSEEAMRSLGDAFHNISAFNESTQDDTAKSPSAAAANDPADYSKVSLNTLVMSFLLMLYKSRNLKIVCTSCQGVESVFCSLPCCIITCRRSDF